MTADAAPAARRVIYRDPVYDGATDPTVVRDAGGGWWMLYTQRRAAHPDPGPGVAWVHGSRVGVARSHDGMHWTYAGTLEPTPGGLDLRAGAPPAEVHETHWAPEVVFDGVRWRMYLTEIDGVPTRWSGHPRRIVEYVSTDLRRWERAGTLALDGDRVIDAAVAHCPDGLWRLWYKDEAAGSVTKVATSADLRSWTPEGIAVGGRAHEGPCVFALGGWWWLLTDEWRGLAVHRSADAIGWRRQGTDDDVILGERGDAASGVQVGRHAMAVVDADAARLYYFSHPGWDGVEVIGAEETDDRRSAVHVASLSVVDGRLVTRQ